MKYLPPPWKQNASLESFHKKITFFVENTINVFSKELPLQSFMQQYMRNFQAELENKCSYQILTFLDSKTPKKEYFL